MKILWLTNFIVFYNVQRNIMLYSRENFAGTFSIDNLSENFRRVITPINMIWGRKSSDYSSL